MALRPRRPDAQSHARSGGDRPLLFASRGSGHSVDSATRSGKLCVDDTSATAARRRDVVMTNNGGSVELTTYKDETNPTVSAVRTSWLEPCGDLGNDLDLVESHLRDLIRSEDPLMSEVSSYPFQGGGKRLRPVLVLLAARLGRGCASPPISM